MRRARTATPGVTTTVVLPIDLHDTLRQLCEASDTSMRSFVTKAITERMARLTNAAGI